jgi:L-ascorbate metabolism protein UlaG (beta-lactamase superfamily)
VHDRIDAVLLSHLHFDHADLRSLRRLQAPVIAPAGAARWLRQHGLTDVSELGCGEATTVGSLRVTATPAQHDRRRHPLGPQADAVGFVASGSRSVYFAGDTDLFPAMAALTGTVDVALIPVAGWGPTLGPGHLDPARAAEAVALIAPAVAIPIHWGTLMLWHLARQAVDRRAPAQAFADAAGRVAPAVDVRVLQPGERTEV